MQQWQELRNDSFITFISLILEKKSALLFFVSKTGKASPSFWGHGKCHNATLQALGNLSLKSGFSITARKVSCPTELRYYSRPLFFSPLLAPIGLMIILSYSSQSLLFLPHCPARLQEDIVFSHQNFSTVPKKGIISILKVLKDWHLNLCS